MRRAVLLFALCLSGCGVLYEYNGPAWHGWAFHGGVSAAGAYASEKVFGTPWIGAALVCGFYLGHEWEETRAWTVFNQGKLDSWADMGSACGVGFGLSLHLR